METLDTITIAGVALSNPELEDQPRDGIMSPQQCRAARAWLNWKKVDLAKMHKIDVSVVSAFERGAVFAQGYSRDFKSSFARFGVIPTFAEDGSPQGIMYRLPDWTRRHPLGPAVTGN